MTGRWGGYCSASAPGRSSIMPLDWRVGCTVRLPQGDRVWRSTLMCVALLVLATCCQSAAAGPGPDTVRCLGRRRSTALMNIQALDRRTRKRPIDDVQLPTVCSGLGGIVGAGGDQRPARCGRLLPWWRLLVIVASIAVGARFCRPSTSCPTARRRGAGVPASQLPRGVVLGPRPALLHHVPGGGHRARLERRVFNHCRAEWSQPMQGWAMLHSRSP